MTASYFDMAREFLAKGIVRYGLPSEGPLYEANLSALIDENLHDFRLWELPVVTRDPALNDRSLTILDLGCGPGTLLFRALSERHDAYGVDLDEGKIALATAWAEERRLPSDWVKRLMIADAGQMPFEDLSFDVVTSYHVLEHVSDLPSVLYEAVRVTKRGGYIELRAPDYRMSFDTHYSMPWPRFMPPHQAQRWCDAMGRPRDGVGTFFYITGPQVVAILQALGCQIVTEAYREVRGGRVFPFTQELDLDPIIVRSDAEVLPVAERLIRLDAEGKLPRMYSTCLEFTIAARRL